ncbi:MAG: BREX system ATP-binding protein BrxD [Myxococcales bacterium]|nr:BREX system ATP-binding protein BrxD [Myxococcales bacterium]
MNLSPLRRRAVLDALRRGTVPGHALDLLAVGLQRFEGAVDEELGAVAQGSAVFKAIRGEYGTGKTFFVRWLQERARQRGLATAEVQISERETPLYRLETVYRRAMDRLSTEAQPAGGALPGVVEQWFFALESDVIADGTDEADPAFEARVTALMEKRLGTISATAPQFAAVLRAWRRARAEGDEATAQGLLAWLGGQPNVGSSITRGAGIKGDMDHFGALAFLGGVLQVLQGSGHGGLVLVLDEVETLQRVRSDVREKSLNALRQLMDELDAGRYPGLYLLITGTSAFFDGPHGVQRLAPLAQRLDTDFGTDARFDNPRAVQVRLTPFGPDRLVEVGQRVRDLFVGGLEGEAAARVTARCDDAWLGSFAGAVTGTLGARVGLAPRIFVKKLVADVLDRVEQFADFDPRRDYAMMIRAAEMAELGEAVDPDDVEL